MLQNFLLQLCHTMIKTCGLVADVGDFFGGPICEQSPDIAGSRLDELNQFPKPSPCGCTGCLTFKHRLASSGKTGLVWTQLDPVSYAHHTIFLGVCQSGIPPPLPPWIWNGIQIE